jgi:hypothetical protein
LKVHAHYRHELVFFWRFSRPRGGAHYAPLMTVVKIFLKSCFILCAFQLDLLNFFLNLMCRNFWFLEVTFQYKIYKSIKIMLVIRIYKLNQLTNLSTCQQHDLWFRCLVCQVRLYFDTVNLLFVKKTNGFLKWSIVKGVIILIIHHLMMNFKVFNAVKLCFWVHRVARTRKQPACVQPYHSIFFMKQYKSKHDAVQHFVRFPISFYNRIM